MKCLVSRCLLGLPGQVKIGEVVTINGEAYLKIVKRQKDLIPSIGEWISFVDEKSYAYWHQRNDHGVSGKDRISRDGGDLR